jgi:hypothetical protein
MDEQVRYVEMKNNAFEQRVIYLSTLDTERNLRST